MIYAMLLCGALQSVTVDAITLHSAWYSCRIAIVGQWNARSKAISLSDIWRRLIYAHASFRSQKGNCHE